MNLLSRVVWSEGMYLGPHHFQVQSRYFEDSIQFAISSLWFASYGLAGVDLDAEALRNGTVSLLHARGIFRDGLPFHMPESDALPEPRAIAELFPPTRDGIVAMLAIPPRKPNGFNCSLTEGEAGDARYVAEPRVLRDENTGADERTVQLGRKNLRLLLDTEPAGDLLTMPIARVVRDGAGHFAYDANFVPPVLRISASTRLMLLVQRLIEILDDKSATIGLGARNTSGGRAEFSTRQIASFWLLHAVNSALTPLRHQLIAKRGHPEELFVEMSRLAGALCTFALDSHPRDLPLYDHDNPSDCFENTRPAHSGAPGDHRSDQLHFDSAETQRRLLLRGRRHRPALPGPFALAAGHPRPHGRRRTDGQSAAADQGLQPGFRAGTGPARPSRNGADSSAGAPAGGFRAPRNAILRREQRWPLLGPHQPDAQSGRVRSR